MYQKELTEDELFDQWLDIEDTLDILIEEFKRTNDEESLMVRLPNGDEMPLLTHFGNEIVLLYDYKYDIEFNKLPECNQIIFKLIDEFNIKYELYNNSIIFKSELIENINTPSIFNDRTILVKNKNTHHEVNEIYIKGKGWHDVPYSFFAEDDEVLLLNVNYKNIDTNETGQADIVPEVFFKMEARSRMLKGHHADEINEIFKQIKTNRSIFLNNLTANYEYDEDFQM